jgi:HEAT repeat protein
LGLVPALFLVVGAHAQVASTRSVSEEPRFNGKPLADWVKALEAEDAETRLQAARALIEIGPAAYTALDKALEDPGQPVCQNTVESLVKIGAPAVHALLAILHERSPINWRHDAVAGTLAAMGEAAHPQLEESLRDKDADTRFNAATILGQQAIGSDEASEAAAAILARALESSDDAAVRLRAAETLGFSGQERAPPKQAIPALAKALQDRDADVQARAAAGLVRLKARQAKDGVPALLKGLESKNRLVREPSFEALATLGPLADAAVPALAKALREGDVSVAVAAARALSKIGQSAIPTLLAALDDPNPTVASCAADALGTVGPDGRVAVPKLLAALGHEHPLVRADAATALGNLGAGDEAVVSTLVNLLDDEGRGVSHSAMFALGRLGSKARPAVPRLIALLKGADDYDREALVHALGSIGPAAEAAIPTLTAVLLKDPERVTKALGQIGPASVPTLIAALKHDSAEVRRWSAWALKYLGPDARDSVPALAALLDESDENVLQAARAALREIGPDAHAAVPRLLATLEHLEGVYTYGTLDALQHIRPSPQEARAALIAHLKSEDDLERWYAAAALVAIGEHAAALPTVIDTLQSVRHDPATQPLPAQGKKGSDRLAQRNRTFYRTITLDLLTEMGPAAAAAAPDVTQVIDDVDEDPKLRVAYARVLARIRPDDPGALTFLRKCLSDPDGPLAVPAALSLVELKQAGDDPIGVLKAVVDGPDGLPAVECASALTQIESQREAAVAFLRKALDAKQKEVRPAAAAALAKAGVADERAIVVLTAELRRLDDGAAQLRAAIALGELGASASSVAADLVEAMHDPDYEVRNAAIAALGKIRGN